MTRIGLVGGYAHERDLLVSWLETVPGVQSVKAVVGDDARRNGSQVVDLVVGIVDGPDVDPLAECRDLTNLGGGGCVVAVLRSASAVLVQRLAAAGVDAMVSMASGPAALRHAIERVRTGAVWLDPALSPFVMRQLGWVPDNDLGLTPKEFEVAQWFPDGLTRSEIAAELGVTEETIKTHIRSIYAKLDVGSRSAAARIIRDVMERRGDPR